jgi:hypothetical protein
MKEVVSMDNGRKDFLMGIDTSSNTFIKMGNTGANQDVYIDFHTTAGVGDHQARILASSGISNLNTFADDIYLYNGSSGILSQTSSTGAVYSVPIYLPTSGGGQGPLNYYEEYTYSIDWETDGNNALGTISGNIITRIGKHVTLFIKQVTFNNPSNSANSYQSESGTPIPSRFLSGSYLIYTNTAVKVDGSAQSTAGVAYVNPSGGQINIQSTAAGGGLNTSGQQGTLGDFSISWNLP